MNVEKGKTNDVLLRHRVNKFILLSQSLHFFPPVNNEKKRQHYLGFHVTNATFDKAEHSWIARNGTGSDE